MPDVLQDAKGRNVTLAETFCWECYQYALELYAIVTGL